MTPPKHKLSLPDPEPNVFWRRLVGIVHGVAGIGFVGWMWYEMPDGCRWTLYLCTPLLIPASCWVIFVSVRGRAEDLQELSGKNVADSAATGAVNAAANAIFDNINF